MTNKYEIELTDTFGGEANYSWVRRATVHMPELTHYGYTGSTDGTYAKANKTANRELMRKAKAAMGLTNVRGRTYDHGDMIEFRPYGLLQVMFVQFSDN
jgi:hypothetical protein